MFTNLLIKEVRSEIYTGHNEERLKIISTSVDIEIRPRIDGKNAEPRIYFQKERIAITSPNDNAET